MSEITKRLAESIKACNSQRITDKDDKALLSQAHETQGLAEELQDALAKLRLDHSKSRRTAISKAVQSRWNASRVERLEKKLRRQQQALDTLLLKDVNLRQRAIQIQQQERFDTLDDTLRYFIRNSAEGFNATQELLLDQAKETRALISEESHQIKHQLQIGKDEEADRAACERLLGSLRYHDMNLRQKSVEERHDKTFEWIFNQDEGSLSYSVPHWLKAGKGVYWVSGKPGSGKSTFMKYLCDDTQTQDLLQMWQEETLMLSFFLWKSGSADQRSSKGLMTSLLYQVLVTNLQIGQRLLNDSPVLMMKHTNADWSMKEATEVLLSALTIASRPLCVFLDGLDEFDEEEGSDKILKIIDRLITSNIGVPLKVCVSSRPEPELKTKLERFPNLRLQDLTRRDIEVYANDILQNAPAEKRSELIDIVVDRADGVFLWVHYALRSILKGLNQYDDWDQVEQRLKALPRRMEELYYAMWLRLNEDQEIYREEAARYFHVAVELTETLEENPSVFQFMIASDALLQETFIERQSEVSTEHMISKCERVKQRIPSCCAGLIEIVDESVDEWFNGSNDESDAEEPEGDESNYSDEVNYSHEGNNSEGEICGARENDHHEENKSDELFVRSESGEGCDEGKAASIRSEPYHLHYFAALSVSFVHRTAKDFLTDTEAGQKILRHFTPPAVNWRVLRLRVKLVAMLAGVELFFWHVAQWELEQLIDRNRLDISEEEVNKILAFMEQACQRRASSTHKRDRVYARHQYGFLTHTSYYQDFLCVTLTCGVASYLHQFFNRVDEGFKIRPAYLNHLLMCSSLQFYPIAADNACFLLRQGADPNAQGSYVVDDEESSPDIQFLECAVVPLPAFLIGQTLRWTRPPAARGYEFCGPRLPDTYQLGDIRAVGFLKDTISCSLKYGIDVSKRILITAQGGMLIYPALPARLFTSYLMYETTIGDVLNYTISRLGEPRLKDFPNDQDYSKTRSIVLVSTGGSGPLSNVGKVSNDADAQMLSDRLETHLSVLYSSVFDDIYKERDFEKSWAWPEWNRLEDCIKDVYHRSEEVNVYEMLSKMGHARRADPNSLYSPVEPFERISEEST
ncbi:MAG: hypothetical protein Q9225_005268 [Loekoesia sp. 1 TL-2023]